MYDAKIKVGVQELDSKGLIDIVEEIVTPKINKGQNMLSTWECIKVMDKINFLICCSDGLTDTVIA